MKRKHFLQLIIVCFYLLESSFSYALTDSQTAMTWVNDKGRELLETFNETDVTKKYQKLDNMFLQHVDLDYIGKFVMGKYWRDMTEVQKSKYQDVFQRYCMTTYKNFPLDFKNKITFTVKKADCSNNYCDVSTDVNIGSNNNGQEQIFLVGFRIKQKNERWQIIDLKLAESSLLLSYRNRFYEMIKTVDGEIDWFLEDLENSLPK